MSLGSLALARFYNLPPRQFGTRRQRDIALPMDDGVTLMTDVYSPRAPGPHPTILMRLPYGRTGFGTVAECYAERGFHVVLQACRGTEKSGGEFDPLVNERADGLATLRWIESQDWYDGRLGLSGPSYLGYAQWAICDALPDRSAMATKVTSAEFQSVVFPSGAFHLGLWLSWLQVIEGLRGNPLKMSGSMFSGGVEKRTAKAAMTLPLVEADVAAVGHQVRFWRHWFQDAIGNHAFWQAIDHRPRLGPRTPPNHFISGWFDFMLDQLLRDYQSLVALGHRPYLTVGPWTHIANDLQAESMRETLTWMRAQLLGDRTGLRDRPVRIHISGLDQWHEFDAYPPGPPRLSRWHLGPGRALTRETPAQPGSDRYVYDPTDPTPNVGGAMFAFTGAGAVDNAPLEARSDVLVYTGGVLTSDTTVIGQCQVTLNARATLPHVDFFVRLNDVGPDGISRNVCDGFVRVTPETPRQDDGNWRLTIPLHATAHSFRPGHRLRLLIASGAHPRYARNPGTGDHIASATRLAANDVKIGHAGTDITLPVYDLP